MNDNKTIIKRQSKRPQKKKVCEFCKVVHAQTYNNRNNKEGGEVAEVVDYIDYMDAATLRKYMTEKGKIIPARMNGNCAYHQRLMAGAIKKARVMALLPYKAE